MEIIKTIVSVSFNYGGWNLIFSKKIILPSAPFYGLILYDKRGEIENIIELKNDDYCHTIITYDLSEYLFDVDVRCFWVLPVSDETIDHTLERFLKTDWIRKDDTDINKLKELMHKDHESFKF